jgi:hypothetical protein
LSACTFAKNEALDNGASYWSIFLILRVLDSLFRKEDK